MAKFRKNPIVTAAHQFDGTIKSAHALVDWVWRSPDAITGGEYGSKSNAGFGPDGLWLRTLESGKEGKHIVDHHDWVICGVKGEFYPCKPDIFAATYEPAD